MGETTNPVPQPLLQWLATARQRLRWRAELLAVAVLGIGALVLLAALDWRAGLLASAAVVSYALVRRDGDDAADGGRQRDGRRAVRSDRGVERQTLVDALPDPTWVLDSDRVVLNANGAARTIFPSLRTGIHVSSAVRHADLIEAVDQSFATGAAQSTVLQLRVPVERRLAVIVAPLLIARGLDSGAAVLVSLRDLTEQDRLAQMRADFVANASHELRTPLASLRGFVETLQGPARNDAAARDRFLAIMSTQADRMTRLIDDLLSLSRVEMRKHLAPTETVDLAEIAGQAMQTLEPQATAAKVQLALKVASQPALVRGDRDELTQVIQNLVQNAIKYGREGGRIDVAISSRPRAGTKTAQIALSVTDDGPGIGPEHIPRLTERFYRVNAPQSRDKGGTGLGLAIVKHIVSRHGGELDITSQLGAGSTFTVILDEAAPQ
jgi:two-component system, OmpR family, phosphate regulon sensor histidine kinase PhoR